MHPEKTGQYLRQDPLDASKNESSISDEEVRQIMGRLYEIIQFDPNRLPGEYSVATEIFVDELSVWDKHFSLTDRLFDAEDNGLFVNVTERPTGPIDLFRDSDRKNCQPALLEAPEFMRIGAVRINEEQGSEVFFAVGAKDESDKWILHSEYGAMVPFVPLFVRFSFQIAEDNMSKNNVVMDGAFMGGKDDMVLTCLEDPIDFSKVAIPRNPRLRFLLSEVGKLMKQGRFPFVKLES